MKIEIEAYKMKARVKFILKLVGNSFLNFISF